jgi:N-acetylglucosaminyldiphosphoundecaprenol N-acetyl-beta-D-mannosaminyltransferase
MESRINLGKCHLDILTMDRFIRFVDSLIQRREPSYICFLEGHTFSRAQQELELRTIYEQAALVLPDGMSLVLASRMCGYKVPGRITASEALLEYCRHSQNNGIRHFFYGGASGVAEKMAINLKRSFPALSIAGTFCPPFRPLSEEETRDVKHRIESSGTDVLWVGLGAPKQERWMCEMYRVLRVPVMLGIGITFDYFANTRPRPPRWVRAMGLEWAYRMGTGGNRIFFRNLKYCTLSSMYLSQAVLRQRTRNAVKNKKTPQGQ